MKANKVYESLQFKQGGNPYTKLGIGVVKIKDLPPSYYPYGNRAGDRLVHIARRGKISGKMDINTTLCGIEDWSNYYNSSLYDKDKIECVECIDLYRELKIN